jgi:hypothetical protein
MPDHSVDQFRYWRLELLQEIGTGWSDSRQDDTPVAAQAHATSEAGAGQPIQKPGDIGIHREHPSGDLAAGNTLSAGSAKDPEDVVLGLRNAVRLEKLLKITGEKVCGMPNAEDGLFAGTTKWISLLQFFLQLAHFTNCTLIL